MSSQAAIDPIAERRLDVVGEPGRQVVVTIGRPVQTPTGEWACHIEIQGTPSAGVDWAKGDDAVQAIQLAFERARRALNESGLLLSVGGGEPGDTHFPRCVPHGFGRAFSEKLERSIDDEVERFFRENAPRHEGDTPR